MDADLDLLLIAVYVTADDLLPDRTKNAKALPAAEAEGQRAWQTGLRTAPGGEWET
ncbi:MAG: hypothetical protein ACTHM1_05335 [Solirubrobacteraceae bacterium]